jgi:ribosomal protein S18 acetylase RimI-like enzyme
MTGEPHVRYRVGLPDDSAAVAMLHADSWRRHYRGAYADAYLDGDIVAERESVWAVRMAQPREDQSTIVAEADDSLVGFVHTVLDADPIWGALVDNLHVTLGRKRRGIGSALLREAAGVVVRRRPLSGLFLWVQEQNVAGQRFYDAQGGVRAGRDFVAPPGGDPGRLNGTPMKLRYAWANPVSLTRPDVPTVA